MLQVNRYVAYSGYILIVISLTVHSDCSLTPCWLLLLQYIMSVTAGNKTHNDL